MYKVIAASNLIEIESVVSEWMEKGWELHGDLRSYNYSANGEIYYEFYQALVKRPMVSKMIAKKTIPAFETIS
jgi:hypothetical protein